MKKVELLAPAGSFEALKAAIASGADAIYLGGSQFGARAYAKNFDQEEIKEAIKLAHLYNVNVYVTINTLVYDHEFKDAMEYIDFLYHSDVDAVIVQDLGLMKSIRKYYPDLEVHASTQMSIHNLEGVKFLEEHGIRRVVLARENSLDEIKYINQNTDAELEVFVHGALCVSYSGQCLMSSLIGGRSGNRGRCAQPCRRLYNHISDEKTINKEQYLISPRDLNTINQIDKIIEAGASSLKIEGRMKSPEYVAIVVSTYRKAIDQYYERNEINLTQSDLDDLTQIFNRQFTEGFMFNKTGNEFINVEKNKNSGVLCGIVQSSKNNKANIKCLKPIHLQDGIFFEGYDMGSTISTMKINGKAVEQANVNAIISIDVKKEVKKGTKVYKTLDVKLNERASKYTLESIPLQAVASLELGKRPQLEIWDDYGHRVNVDVDFIIEESKKQDIEVKRIEKQVKKTQDTEFYFKSLEIKKDNNIFIAFGALNELRRKGIDKIRELRSNKYNRQLNVTYNYQPIDEEVKDIEKTLSVYCETIPQVEAAIDCDIKNIYVNEDIYDEVKDKEFIVAKNRIQHQPQIKNTLDKILVSDLGTLLTAKNISKEFITNVYLNVTNSETIKFLRENNVDRITLSYEMNQQSYRDLLYENKSICEVIVYGHQEAMVTKYSMLNKEHDEVNNYLVDKKKEKFHVRRDTLGNMHIYNSKKLILGTELIQLINYGYRQFRCQFTIEDYEETVKVIKAYEELLFNDNSSWINSLVNTYKEKKEYTRGHYNKKLL